MAKNDFIYSLVIVILIMTNVVTYMQLNEYNRDPLNKLSSLKRVELTQKLMFEGNFSYSNKINNKEAEWIYFYLDYSIIKRKLELVKVYKFSNGARIFEHQKYYDANKYII